MTRILCLFLALFLTLPATGWAQQDVSGLLNRIARLERELSDLQRSVYAGGPPPSAASATPLAQPDAGGGSPLARIEIRLQQIEAELRAVTGRVEELGFRVQGVSDRVDKLQTDTDIRFNELTGTPGGSADIGSIGQQPAPAPAASSGSNGAAQTGTAPVAGAPAGTLGTLSGQDLAVLQATAPPPAAPAGSGGAAPASVVPTDGNVEQQYKTAFEYLVKHDLPSAETAFTAFLQQHPDDPLAGNAQYWLGETFYARDRFQEAAVAFLEGYQTYPNSPKAADNLLKLGMSLARIDRREEACTTFAKLNQDFPNAPTNIKRRLVNEVKALNCGG